MVQEFGPSEDVIYCFHRFLQRHRFHRKTQSEITLIVVKLQNICL